MEIGIIGLPNVGKSTLFNALTGAGAAAQNFPFTTIEPNVGIVPLPDERLSMLAEKNGSAKITPAALRFVDIAGLVKGASRGEGLGNTFLSHIRTVDAVCHVVRCFRDEEVVNVIGELSPADALEIIETELLLADLQQAQRALEKYRKPARSGDARARVKVERLEKAVAGFDAGRPARRQGLPPEFVAEFQFLTAKPLLYVANVDEGGAPPDALRAIEERARAEEAGLVVLSAKLEAEIMELPAEERAAYYAEAEIATPGLGALARAGKDLLGLVCFYTSGPQETRAWLIPKGTPAVRAAGKIHSDMERGFIRAEVYAYDRLMEAGSYRTLQEKGEVRLEGKEYVVQDGDVVYFRFNV